MELKTVRDAFDRVAKKQKLSTSRYQQVIDQVGDEIKQAMTDIQSVDPPSSIDHKSVITNLKRKLDTVIPQEQLEKSQKELNTNLSQYPKILGKFFDTDISKAYRSVDFDLHIVNQIIISQLYHEGLFDVADILINEAQEPEIISLRCQFAEMHQILKALRARNLEPALSWVLANRQKLQQSGNEFLKLMGCLLWPGKLETSPYSDLLLPAKWEDLIKEFTMQFCSLIGVSFKNPLGLTIEKRRSRVHVCNANIGHETTIGSKQCSSPPPIVVNSNLVS
ncbi:protein RMD5 homolog [Cynara cardunculus var. scolymus]|uniref:protein RMD5 homolog n=1 Tax=Cynara cardunculus var. scolymus TaxID=59895 RepID=UPI000D626554|nr:protein RMD5 homolog [Cynara cardunculus var. scolymus]